MEVGCGRGEKTGFFTQGRRSLQALAVQFIVKMPLYSNFDETAIWAIMTVVVVFEFSVGATLGKGLNRGLATLLAGGLSIGAHHVANLSGNIGEPILLGFFVFLQATISTFLRFFPEIKARYDYGLLIFILTFAMISVSGFREDEILELAYRRLSTICIGAAACVIISIMIFPVWAGEDLHNLITLNIEKLGSFLEGFGDKYFNRTGDEEGNDGNKFSEGYKSSLNSKTSEGSLANFAAWEPGHGRFPYRHPWKLYLKVGTLARECAYRIEALNGYLNNADFQESSEVSTILTLKMAKSAAKNMKSLLKSGIWEDIDLLKVIPGIAVGAILVDVVTCTEKIAESIHELASKRPNLRV
ncbi:hypothetical protein OIU85_001044 [Salix viminalis]|uniref:Aluminum-activated malate transporter n=1 Tax=Salix viminalis TaxID=40686 RepID=A0A9Q0VL72_SALVM|nr:hypothetical protein OIU85_001044 [Salix viminalis]